MKRTKMEKTKYILDISIVVFGLLAAFAAVFGLMLNKKINDKNEIEKQKMQIKLAESTVLAEKARKEAANAINETAQINERALRLELETESQKERAALAEKELLILKNKIKPRTITINNKNYIISELKKIPKGEINFGFVLGSLESKNYCTQFRDIFIEAGWTTSGKIGSGIYGRNENLLIIKDESFRNTAELIKNIFSQKNINLGIYKPKIPPASDFAIHIIRRD